MDSLVLSKEYLCNLQIENFTPSFPTWVSSISFSFPMYYLLMRMLVQCWIGVVTMDIIISLLIIAEKIPVRNYYVWWQLWFFLDTLHQVGEVLVILWMNCLSINKYSICLNILHPYRCIIMWVSILLILLITLIDVCIFNQLYISKINSTLSWCIILLCDDRFCFKIFCWRHLYVFISTISL